VISKLPHFVNNRLRDESEVFSLTCRLRSISQKPILFKVLSLVLTSVRSRVNPSAGRIRSIERKFKDFIGSGIRDLPAYSTVPPSTVTTGPVPFVIIQSNPPIYIKHQISCLNKSGHKLNIGEVGGGFAACILQTLSSETEFSTGVSHS
jgi:hypothetical protein